MARGLPRTKARAPDKVAIIAITPLTGAFGTTGSAIVDVTGTFSQSIINNNLRALEDKINAILTAQKL